MSFQIAAISLVYLMSAFAMAQSEPPVVHLWKNGAPGFESLKNQPEEAKDYWVRNVNDPSITVYLPPKEKATGAAVLVVPGGGHRLLVFNAEGRQPAAYLSNLGVAAFALKYRLSREDGSPYKIENSVQDAYRAMRLIRSRAAEWNIDPSRVGVLGFSAGGEIASLITYGSGKGNPKAADPIDRLDGRPDFEMLVYPGPLGVPDVIPADAPPLFMVVADDDDLARVVVDLLQKYRKANRPVEAHILERGHHAFNMGDRSKLASVNSWPQRMADWLADNNYFDPSQPIKN